MDGGGGGEKSFSCQTQLRVKLWVSWGFDSKVKQTAEWWGIISGSFEKKYILVNADTEDFEEYILKMSPAIVTNNAAENPTLISSDTTTFRESCENRRGMGGNKNYPRCPADLLVF